MWFHIDPEAVAAHLARPLAPFYLQAAPAAGAPDWPRARPPEPRFRNDHLGYALTWFALAGGAGYLLSRLAPPRREGGPCPASFGLICSFTGRGHHEASWRHPQASPLALTDFEFHRELACKAEAAAFDSIFLADTLSMAAEVAHTARSWLEPITLLGALAAATSRIGLIATASTTYTEPFNLARQFASLDHISRGRIGWNIVTSWSVAAAHNYGDDAQVSHAERYARAEEYMAVVKALWDSWADDAVLDDRPAGRYARARSHPRARPRRGVVQGRRAAEHAALPAGPAGVRAGGLVGDRARLRRPPRRGGVHRAAGEDHGAGLLYGPEGAGGEGGARPGAGGDPAGLQPADRRDARGGGAPGAGAERAGPIPRSAGSGSPGASAASISAIWSSTGR